MIEGINDNFFNFIESNRGKDWNRLLLANAGKDTGFDIRLAVLQLECRKKCESKLPDFCKNPRTIFPSSLSSEQCSSEVLASFHASLVPEGSSVIDITAGLSIDSFAFCRRCIRVKGIERDGFVSEISAHNADAFGINNFNAVAGDSIEVLQNCTEKYDVLFVDPARRKADSGRAYDFSDCSPDIIAHKTLLESVAPRIIIKASPMLDLSRIGTQIPEATDIYVTSVEGECKEIIVDARRGNLSGELKRHAIDFDRKGGKNYHFTISGGEVSSGIRYLDNIDSATSAILYIPDAGIMKLRPWGKISEEFPSLLKLHPNSHIFVSKDFYPDFPGRVFRINGIHTIKDNAIRNLKGEKINVLSRNFPLNAPELAKRLKVKDGGSDYVLGTRISDGSTRLFLLSLV